MSDSAPVSLYQLHRCIYDYVRAAEVSASSMRDFDVNRYDLTEDERKAFESTDIAALYQLGLHEVLLNRFCRQAGFSRNEYRKILEPLGKPEERKGRWQK
jgi:hypothetical protein